MADNKMLAENVPAKGGEEKELDKLRAEMTKQLSENGNVDKKLFFELLSRNLKNKDENKDGVITPEERVADTVRAFEKAMKEEADGEINLGAFRDVLQADLEATQKRAKEAGTKSIEDIMKGFVDLNNDGKLDRAELKKGAIDPSLLFNVSPKVEKGGNEVG